jgi:nitroimidazol reductase NimA-like FMN-containing flavoprotein (pyridoxamine 5'-phosphate oxidase superfamily)
MPDLHELSYSECLALLRASVVGRIAVSAQDGPHVVPVNYSVSDTAVLMRAGPDGPVARFGIGVRVAFQIDHVDYTRRRGWSVLVRGTTALVDDPVEAARIRSSFEPVPWASGDRSLLLELPWTEITGRRLGDGWQPMSELPVRRIV